jgi:RIO-like serine/threonine protein kinase
MSYFHDNYRKFNTGSGLLVCAKTSLTISDSLADELIRQSQNQVGNGGEKAGRAGIYFGELRSGEKFALRRYVRGGFAKHVTTDSYISLPRSSLRPLLEMEITAELYGAGVKVVEPLFSIIEYGSLGLSYSGAIATTEVLGAKNFMEVASTLSVNEAERIASDAGREAMRVLKLGIFHRDLHPGNVIINLSSQVILLDFDKAMRFNPMNYKNYIQPIIDRWERAVIKRSLNPVITSSFALGLKEEGENKD